MRKLRGKKLKKQKRVIILSITILMIFFTTGYAAFSTKIRLNAKGNIKKCYVGKKWDYDFQNRSQEFTAICSGTYKIELWGAGNTYAGGGYTKGEIELTNNDTFYVYVGEKGHTISNGDPEGGFNGGGNSSPTSQGKTGAGGSGATDIRTVSGDWDNFASLKSRIMVAGGAGGNNANAFLGSNGGGLDGYDGYNTTYAQYIGKGATQLSGGALPTKYNVAQTNGTVGLFGKGGVGGMSRDDTPTGGGSGGGSGYFGGSGASGLSSGTFPGGGGSSFISGHTGCIAIDENSTEDNIIQRNGTNNISCIDNPTAENCSHHYSNYVFNETVIIDGAGYEWTSQKGDYIGQTQPDGTIKKGNQGNGHARITLLSLQ